MASTIRVIIKNREKTLFDGELRAISTFNDVGIFDILPNHENFISLIKDKIILHKEGSDKQVKIGQGVLKARENKVNIYLDL